MNAHDILAYGHQDVLHALEDLLPEHWIAVGVTPLWSLKDLVAHLASFELFLEDAFKSVLDEKPTPTLDAMGHGASAFNRDQISLRREHPREQVVQEYVDAHHRVMELVARLGPARLAAVGTIPWYGASYSLDDLVVYANYGHKREHCAQIRAFRRQLGV